MTMIKPRTARVVIYQGDDLARLAELDAAVETSDETAKRAEKASNGIRLMTDADPAAEAKAAHEKKKAERDAFAEAAQSRGVAVVLHALPRKEWRRLVTEHPARDRDAHPEDYPIGPCNIETMPDALLPKSICRDEHCPTCVDMEQRSTIEGDLVEFLESLADADYYDSLFWTAWTLNRGAVTADPTLRLGSAPSQTSVATSS